MGFNSKIDYFWQIWGTPVLGKVDTSHTTDSQLVFLDVLRSSAPVVFEGFECWSWLWKTHLSNSSMAHPITKYFLDLPAASKRKLTHVFQGFCYPIFLGDYPSLVPWSGVFLFRGFTLWQLSGISISSISSISQSLPIISSSTTVHITILRYIDLHWLGVCPLFRHTFPNLKVVACPHDFLFSPSESSVFLMKNQFDQHQIPHKITMKSPWWSLKRVTLRQHRSWIKSCMEIMRRWTRPGPVFHSGVSPVVKHRHMGAS